MSLTSIAMTDVRSIAHASLEFGAGLNLVHGPNGSGKTSILESIFLLGRGRSFRTRHTEHLIARGKPKLTVFGQTIEPTHRVGFEYTRQGDRTGRIDGRNVKSLAELPETFFVEVIDPEIHRLVDGGPGERRRWLDWGVFHVEHTFLDHWVRFTRALNQRNAVLKAGGDPQPWDAEVAVHGEKVALDRERWFAAMESSLRATVQRLSGLEVEATYSRGWPADLSLTDSLRSGLDRDRQRATTISGPHRADIVLRVDGRPARESVSRGQQKMVAAAMVLALLASLNGQGGIHPTLLLDDPAAELDGDRLRDLVDLVKELHCQLVVTSLDPGLHAFGSPERVFHVEHGTVQRL